MSPITGIDLKNEGLLLPVVQSPLICDVPKQWMRIGLEGEVCMEDKRPTMWGGVAWPI